MEKFSEKIEIYKKQIEYFCTTRDIQWKVNIAFWSFIIASGAFLYGKYAPSLWEAIVIILIFTSMYCIFWAYPVQISLEYDKRIFVQLRKGIIPFKESDKKHNKCLKMPRGCFWVVSQTAITVLFLVFIFWFLYRTSPIQKEEQENNDTVQSVSTQEKMETKK